jgi:hypothetical protein
MNALERVCATLDTHSIRYALIGAAAMAAHGVARSTFDVDLLTTDRRVLTSAMWADYGGATDVRPGDVDDPLAGVVRIALADERPVDVVVGKHTWQSRAVERARPLGDRIATVLARDLVLLKLYAGSPQDILDVRELLRDSPPSLAAEVSEDVASLSTEMRQHWEAAQQTQ